jgi:hypothetical protein
MLFQSFIKGANKNKKGATHEYVNEAYQRFPEEDEDDGYKISDSDDNDDDVSSDDTDTTTSNNDSAYQTISKTSSENAPCEQHRRKSTKNKLR